MQVGFNFVQKFMGLSTKAKQSNTLLQPQSAEVAPQDPYLSLTVKEIEFIITVLGEADIKVKQIEFVYALLVKLQEYYVQRKSTNP